MTDLKDIIKEYNRPRKYSMALYQAAAILKSLYTKAEITDIGLNDLGFYICFRSEKFFTEKNLNYFYIPRDIKLEIETHPMNTNEAMQLFESKHLKNEVKKLQKTLTVKKHSTLEVFKETKNISDSKSETLENNYTISESSKILDINYLVQYQDNTKSIIYSGLFEYQDLIPLAQLKETHKISIIPKKFVNEETKKSIQAFGSIYDIKILNTDFLVVVSELKNAFELSVFIDAFNLSNYKVNNIVSYAFTAYKSINLAGKLISYNSNSKHEDILHYAKKFELDQEDIEILNYFETIDPDDLGFIGMISDLSNTETVEEIVDGVKYYNYKIEAVLRNKIFND